MRNRVKRKTKESFVVFPWVKDWQCFVYQIVVSVVVYLQTWSTIFQLYRTKEVPEELQEERVGSSFLAKEMRM